MENVHTTGSIIMHLYKQNEACPPPSSPGPNTPGGLFTVGSLSAGSMLRPTMKIRNKGIPNVAGEKGQNGKEVKKRETLKVLANSLKAWFPKTGEKCILMSVNHVAGFEQDTFIYLCPFHPSNMILLHFTHKET